MLIYEAIKEASLKLSEAMIESPKLEAEIIIANILNITKSQLIIRLRDEISESENLEINECVKKRIAGIPLQYITGETEIYGLKFKVTPDVLIPRDDTEVCIEEAIKYIGNNKDANILDICTGSGCIGICIAKKAVCNVVCSDISPEALNKAKENSKLNNVEDNIMFVQSNMFENIGKENKFDLIISNPPYIRRKEILNLKIEVRKEPNIALDGGEDGIDFYRIILDNAKKYLKDGGMVILEIGYDQKEDLFKLIDEHEEYIDARCIKDINKNDRVIICRFQKK